MGKPLTQDQVRRRLGVPKDKTMLFKTGGEAQAQQRLAAHLETQGWTVTLESPIVGVGKIDILAERQGRVAIVEVKVGGVTECARGVGQVWLYATKYAAMHDKEALPVLAVPALAADDPDLEALCDHCGVRLWTLPDANTVDDPT